MRHSHRSSRGDGANVYRTTAGWVIGVAWCAAVVAALWCWGRYETTAGPTGAVAAKVDPSFGGRWQLVVFVHPRCPCTRATLSETGEIARAAPDLMIRIVFVRPADAPDEWERTEQWTEAGRLPGVEVECDAGGREAVRLGAETSGHAVLLDPTGRVVFRGGLTRARGQQGISPGRRAVLDWIEGNQGAKEMPVFGCPLRTTDN